MSYNGLSPPATSPKIMTAVIANTPANTAAKVWVRIPSWGGQQRFGPCPWSPKGAALPQAGGQCLVALDENDLPWIVQWV